MKKTLTTLSTILALNVCAYSQATFNTMETLDVNKIKATVLVHGDMWWNPVTEVAACNFPKDSATSANFASALWMSGYDAGNQLHVSAQTYRQDGNDYWPGPIDASDTLLLSSSSNWAKIWKVNRSEIDAFTLLTTHTLANTPPAILTWPAKGNPNAQGNLAAPLTITTDMAPFVDLNSNGIYEPLLGEYPDVPGDQALWWVFSDKGPTHTQSNGKSLGFEIHALAYAYARGTLIDNVQYYSYTILNKSANTYHNFRLGLFDDIDMGYYHDDYIGFDSTWRLGYCYNAIADDGLEAGHSANSYGTHIPITGITLVDIPGDGGGVYVPTGSFSYYNNDFSVLGNPTNDSQFNNYLRSRWRDGTHFTNDSGVAVNYVYNGDPNDVNGWSECRDNNTPGDRRFILTTNDYTLNADAQTKVVMAMIITNPDTAHACPNMGHFDDIKILADTAWGAYHNPPPVLPAAVNNVAVFDGIKVYPNPANDQLTVELISSHTATMKIINAIGQEIPVPVAQNNNIYKLDIKLLPAGVYLLRIKDGDELKAATFVKR